MEIAKILQRKITSLISLAVYNSRWFGKFRNLFRLSYKTIIIISNRIYYILTG